MSAPKFRNADGTLTAYALACGYVQSDTLATEDGRRFHLRLSHNGCTYDIDLVPDVGAREWTRLPNGGKIVTGWAQFDSLTPARKLYRKVLRARNVGEAYVACLAVMA